MQDFAFLVEFPETPVSPFLQPIDVLLDANITFEHFSHFSKLGVISKLSEGTFCPILQTMNEDPEQDWTRLTEGSKCLFIWVFVRILVLSFMAFFWTSCPAVGRSALHWLFLQKFGWRAELEGILPFYVWLLLGAFSSFASASWHFCLMTCLLE